MHDTSRYTYTYTWDECHRRLPTTSTGRMYRRESLVLAWRCEAAHGCLLASLCESCEERGGTPLLYTSGSVRLYLRLSCYISLMG